MTPDIILELSVEQLTRALSKKLTIECTKAKSMMPPMAMLVAEVRFSGPKGNH